MEFKWQKGIIIMYKDTRAYKPSLFGMILNPNEQFDRMEDRPIFLGAMMSVIALTVIGMWLNLSGFDINEVITAQELTDFTPEELAAFEVLSKLTFIVIGLVGSLLKVIVSSLLFLIFARTFEAKVTFKQLFSMNTYILFIVSLGVFVNGFITAVLSADPESMFTSLSVLIKMEGPFGELLKNIEIFEIWGLVLTAIGLQKVAKYPKKVAWIIAILFFVFTVIMSISNTGADPMAIGFY